MWPYARSSTFLRCLEEFLQHVHRILDQLFLHAVVLVWVADDGVDVLQALSRELVVDLFLAGPEKAR